MQAAVFIAKAKGLAANEAAANNFIDAASIPAWAKGAVGAAVSAGYLSGYPDGSFGGSKDMTRAEAVSTLNRVLDRTSTSNQGTSQGEVDTTDRDSQQKEETTTTANAGDMVWTSGGSTNVKVDDKASVDKIEVKDDTAANIKVNGNGEVGTVAVSGKAGETDLTVTGKISVAFKEE